LVAAAAIMPLLAKEKRQLSADTGNAALRADAAESALCAYLSLIALAGLALNTIWHVAWADPVAALALPPLIVREARELLLKRNRRTVIRMLCLPSELSAVIVR
jgi:divalent metal cation (Fe/Co/Zn/Cd) transporter